MQNTYIKKNHAQYLAFVQNLKRADMNSLLYRFLTSYFEILAKNTVMFGF